MKQCYWIMNPIEVKSVYHFLFEANVKLVRRNMKLHKVSHEGTLSQSMSTLSCIPFILMTIDMSSSLRIEKLPSSCSSESAGWKVLHWKKKMTDVHFLHLVNFTEFRSLYIHYYSVSSREICQNRIAGIGLFNLSRSHSFFPGFVLFIYLLWMFHDKK